MGRRWPGVTICIINIAAGNGFPVQLGNGEGVCGDDGVSNNILQIYIIQQYFTVAAPNTAFTKYLKQIKYKMLVVVHTQSAENVRLQWCF